MMVIVWLTALCFIYAVLAGVLIRGSFRKFPVREPNKLPSISVIVPARNEEENIAACLESLNRLQYPKDLLQILIVNHLSEDGTHKIVSEFVKDKRQFKYIEITAEPEKTRGKASALSVGIKNSSGEILFFTDADCIVPPEWLQRMVKYFTPKTGMVLGFTKINRGKSIFSRLQEMDWLYFLSAAACAAGLNKPLSWIGNNLAIRKNIYDEIGGFEAIGPTITEDFALLNAVHKKTNAKISVCRDEKSFVLSQPLKSLSELISQRKRWAMGGKDAPLLAKLLIAYSFLIHFIIMTLFSLGDFFSGGLMFSLVLIFDAAILARTLSHQKRWNLILWLPIYKIFAFSYIFILAISLLLKKDVRWKGIRY